MYDPVKGAADRALGLIGPAIAEQQRYGLAPAPETVVPRITIAASIATALPDASLVQECGPERVEIKRELFAALDRHAAADTILASSTSAISTPRTGRVVIS